MNQSIPVGVSSACFYPVSVKESLQMLGRMGIPRCEVFFNTFSELRHDWLRDLRLMLDDYGITVPSVHPFTSEMEYFFFFSSYPGRVEDGLDLYRRFFEAANILGAKILVFHGDRITGTCSVATYAQRFAALRDVGREYGVTVCQEDVPRCRCSNVPFIKDLRRELHDDVSFTADFKQALRAGMDIDEMLDAMGPCLRHVHISDNSSAADCLAPGAGTMDFPRVLKKIQSLGNVENLMIELYSNSFANPQEVADSWRYLCGIMESIQK